MTASRLTELWRNGNNSYMSTHVRNVDPDTRTFVVQFNNVRTTGPYTPDNLPEGVRLIQSGSSTSEDPDATGFNSTATYTYSKPWTEVFSDAIAAIIILIINLIKVALSIAAVVGVIYFILWVVLPAVFAYRADADHKHTPTATPRPAARTGHSAAPNVQRNRPIYSRDEPIQECRGEFCDSDYTGGESRRKMYENEREN